MDEFFAHAGPAGRSEAYLDELKWRRQIRAILCCEKLGRGYLAQSNGDEHDHDARVYSLASFLTGAGSRSAFNYNPAGGATNQHDYPFPEWYNELGRPVRQ